MESNNPDVCNSHTNPAEISTPPGALNLKAAKTSNDKPTNENIINFTNSRHKFSPTSIATTWQNNEQHSLDTKINISEVAANNLSINTESASQVVYNYSQLPTSKKKHVIVDTDGSLDVDKQNTVSTCNGQCENEKRKSENLRSEDAIKMSNNAVVDQNGQANLFRHNAVFDPKLLTLDTDLKPHLAAGDRCFWNGMEHLCESDLDQEFLMAYSMDYGASGGDVLSKAAVLSGIEERTFSRKVRTTLATAVL